MRLKYPHAGSDLSLIFEERFTDPLHLQHNQGTVNLVGAATLPIDHGATFPTIASGLTAYVTYPSSKCKITACKAMTVVFDATFLAFDAVVNTCIFQKYENATNEWVIVVQAATGKAWATFRRNGVSYGCFMTPALPTGSRVEVAFTWSGAATLGYLNGSVVASAASNVGVVEPTGALIVGSGTNQLRSCTLHHVRVWNRALSAADIAALYAGRDVIL